MRENCTYGSMRGRAYPITRGVPLYSTPHSPPFLTISRSSTCIIFGQVTDEQMQGYERLTNFQKLIVRDPREFNLWLTKDREWKEDRVRLVKREIQFGRHRGFLEDKQPDKVGFNVFKALEERKGGQI